jgi:hypothetical protein
MQLHRFDSLRERLLRAGVALRGLAEQDCPGRGSSWSRSLLSWQLLGGCCRRN